MRKIWIIFKREYITRVRTKGFVFGTVAVPVFGIGIIAVSVLMATKQIDHTLKLAIIDEAGGVAQTVTQGLDGKLTTGQPMFDVVRTIDSSAANANVRRELIAEINGGGLDGFLVIPKDATSAKSVEFHTKNTGDFMTIEPITHAVDNAVIARRLEERGVHVTNVKELVRGVALKLVKVTKQGETEDKGQTFIIGIIVAMLLYTTLIMYGVITMRSVLEEKTTRIVEVLISAVRPFQLLAGKILGVAAVACTQYLIWITAAALLGAYGVTMASAFRPGASGLDFLEFHIPIPLLVYMVVYFLLGYLLYASLYASIGAAASNEQDAQQLQWPVTLPILFSFLMFNYVLRDASSTLSVVLSEIPFFAPILMLLRMATQAPPFWQIALSVVLLLLTSVGVIYFSARIYRVGILMYGKRPSVVELFRWLRYT